MEIWNHSIKPRIFNCTENYSCEVFNIYQFKTLMNRFFSPYIYLKTIQFVLCLKQKFPVYQDYGNFNCKLLAVLF